MSVAYSAIGALSYVLELFDGDLNLTDLLIDTIPSRRISTVRFFHLV